MSKTIGYMRVSTKEQKTDRQFYGLKELCDEIYVEQISAATKARTRPVYKKMLRKLHTGDTFIVWNLDRAFRNTMDALHEAERLLDDGIHFKIVALHVDTTTATGKFSYTIFSAVAQFESDFCRERTMEGIAAARRAGKHLGRPPKLSDDQVAGARQRLKGGNITIAALAKEYEVWPWTLSRSLNRNSTTH